MAQETAEALDPKPTSAELEANRALLDYLGKTVFLRTLSYLCASDAKGQA